MTVASSSPTAPYGAAPTAPEPRTRPTIPDIRARKGGDPLVMVTAYDAPTARIASEGGVDLILVGDSVAMVVLGYDDTLQVTIDDLCHHTAAVARARPAALIVGDMPWMSYHTDPTSAVNNAARLIRAGAQCVKLEGGRSRVPVIEALVAAEIPVMGHLGLTPQSINALGGYKVQAKQLDSIAALVADAKAVEAAGCFAVVLECVPAEVAAVITSSINIPTIGIGAGTECDGQVLVFHDLAGYEERRLPKFVRRYADLHAAAVCAVRDYCDDVRSHLFPSDDESYHLAPETVEVLPVIAPLRAE